MRLIAAEVTVSRAPASAYNSPVLQPTAVLFDLDGTLIDTVPFILACFRHAFHGHPRAPGEAQLRAGIGTPLQLQMAQFAREPAEVDELVGRYRAYWQQHHDEMTRAFPGALETVSALSGAGHPLAVVTAKTEHGALISLRHTGLLEHMGVVIGADSCARCKPDPEPVLLALQRLGSTPARAVLVGDAVHDLAAARAAGVLPLGAAWGATPPQALAAAGAARLLSDIRELPNVVAALEAAAA